MRRVIGILSSIGLVLLGIGVVRPQVVKQSEAAWEVVAQGQKRAPLAYGSFDLTTTGEHLLFLEGPADDPAWGQSTDIAVQLLDHQSSELLPSSQQGVEYEYDHAGRRAVALGKITVMRAGTYDVHLGRGASPDLQERGFELAVIPWKVVDDQATESKLWLAGGVVGGVLMALLAVSMLSMR